jgi:hypothetical protein
VIHASTLCQIHGYGFNNVDGVGGLGVAWEYEMYKIPEDNRARLVRNPSADGRRSIALGQCG